jgi:predicted secreted hydrolase
LGIAVLAGAAWLLNETEPQSPPTPTLTVAEGLSGDDSEGFARAFAARTFSFPADHGPHPEYKTEWWYFTGNLKTAGGRHFGYQLTLFRIGLTSEPAERPSRWAASELYMGHFAVSDVAGERFHAHERFSRAALGLAGAQAPAVNGPFRVWLEDWTVQGQGPEALPLRLKAAQDEVAIDLELESAKPAVLQGDQGLLRKSTEPGNASYYYSLTRMPTRGTLRIGRETYEVRGLSWMDREWSTNPLAKDQRGWDWFALQLSDGRELMFYQLWRRDGSPDPVSAGTLVTAEGEVYRLSLQGVRIEVRDHWKSSRGTLYPSRWRLQVPGRHLNLEIIPYLAHQELDLTVRYWEGAVRVQGSSDGQPIEGNGYMELTGYGDG